MFAPLAYDSTFSAVTIAGRRGEFLSVIGRLRPGQTVQSAVQDVRNIGAKLQKQFPDTNETLTFTARSLTDALLSSAALASYIPARRVAEIQPGRVLR